jgi:hypothetical protein
MLLHLKGYEFAVTSRTGGQGEKLEMHLWTARININIY